MDWLIALDDHLCGRFSPCTLCQQRPGTGLWLGVWELSETRSAAYLVCHGCRNRPTWETEVHDLMTQRYRLGRFPPGVQMDTHPCAPGAAPERDGSTSDPGRRCDADGPQ